MIPIIKLCVILGTAVPEGGYPCFQKLYNGACAGENSDDVLGQTPWRGVL